jgi:hypothetical protein
MGKYATVIALLVGLSNSAFARDDGRYANDPLKYWFDNLTSSNGKCCSFADGFSVSDVDWDTEDGHYRVLLHGEWINVPNSSIVSVPNRYGRAVVWPYRDSNGNINIRCFRLEAVHKACACQFCRPTSATRTSSTPCGTRSLRQSGLRAGGGISWIGAFRHG